MSKNKNWKFTKKEIAEFDKKLGKLNLLLEKDFSLSIFMTFLKRPLKDHKKKSERDIIALNMRDILRVEALARFSLICDEVLKRLLIEKGIITKKEVNETFNEAYNEESKMIKEKINKENNVYKRNNDKNRT